MTFDPLAALHEPLLPIMRHVLEVTPLARSGIGLDLACGTGQKTPLLAELCGSGLRLVGIDRDLRALQVARQRAESFAWVAGDALSLPLRDGCCAAAFCIATLGLFDDQTTALRELRRVLQPGGRTFFVTGIQAWALVVRWPDDLAERISTAYLQALRSPVKRHRPLDASPDVIGPLVEQLAQAGFGVMQARAFLLNPVPHPIQAELPLLGWTRLRPLVDAELASADLLACDRLGAEPDVELCAVALVALAEAS